MRVGIVVGFGVRLEFSRRRRNRDSLFIACVLSIRDIVVSRKRFRYRKRRYPNQ